MFVTQMYFKHLVKSELVLLEENLLKSIGFIFVGIILVLDNIQLGNRAVAVIESKFIMLTSFSAAITNFVTISNLAGGIVLLPDATATRKK